jgi:hypothetical protein
LGGRSVLRWQAEWVRALGCERVICLCDAPAGDVLQLQGEVEQAGGEFHAIRGNFKIPALVRAEDELIILRRGLVVDRDRLLGLAMPGGTLRPCIATLPASHPSALAHPEHFERIDRERSWAGYLAMRGAAVQKLADLPPDADAVSLLLRLALQEQVPAVPLDPEVPARGEWLLATQAGDLEEREAALIAASAPNIAWSGAGQALGAWIARLLAPGALASGPGILALLAVVLLAISAVMSTFGLRPAGLALAATGALAGAASDAAATMRSALLGASGRPFSARNFNILIDIQVTACLVLAMGLQAPEDPSPILALFAIGLARLAARGASPVARAFWRDRALQLVLFAGAAVADLLGPALGVFGLAALTQLLVHPARNLN